LQGPPQRRQPRHRAASFPAHFPVAALVLAAAGGAPVAPEARPAPPPGERAAAPGRDAASLYKEALVHYRAGRPREALAVIRSGREAGVADAALRTLAGWCHLRLAALDDADAEFRAALASEPRAVEPRVGLGYVLLRRGRPRDAEERFAEALGSDPRNADALKGLGLALRDRGRHAEAADRFRAVLAIDPGDAEAKRFLDQALAAGGGQPESRRRPPVPQGTPLRVVAQARDGRFHVGEGSAALPFFVKGINFGVALPGRFPAEFPEERATYEEWLAAAADLGANAVRLYTLLPPSFYAALEAHNRRRPASGRIWLIQGVWTELPADHDYDAAGFLDEFKNEIRRVIDAVHGNLDLPARPGHAHGAYRADVSSSLLAWLPGREWEPFSVAAYDRLAARRGAGEHRGTYFTARGGTPFEAWLARLLEFTVDYETERYRQQRPVSFVSWPTLDPLRHPTEATVAEERALRAKAGETVGPDAILEYDNDGVSVDGARIAPTAAARGGVYATYHAYPYYPDFMNVDPGYLRARDRRGPSNYIGYLRDLKRHHGAQPVLIAEFGVPGSRGVAHLQPQGWHHGGHTEKAQAEIGARLLMNIREAGLAGGVLFALLDEWFKRNWLVMDYEVPYERNPLWLNVLDPEQNYGVLAARPGAKGWTVVVDGRPGDWTGRAPLAAKAPGGPLRRFDDGHDAARTLRGLWAAADEAYLYLRLDVERLDADGDGRPDWDEAWYLIGIDTYDAERGDRRLPLAEKTASPAGLEFCVVLDGAGTARLLVDPPYDVQGTRRRPYGSAANDDGRFVPLVVETNRRRLGRDGTVYREQHHDRSPLVHGSLDRDDADHTTLADWRAGAASGTIEIRLGWGLLNVADPSSRRVVHDDPKDLRRVGTVATPGFRFIAAAVKPDGPPGGATPVRGRLADLLPADAARAADLPLFTWPAWERPSYRIERKEGWPILEAAFRAIPTHPVGP
jgi:tetratricopeptide (TPR) repeat protein